MQNKLQFEPQLFCFTYAGGNASYFEEMEKDTLLTEMMEWKTYFVGDVDFYRYKGSHFFIRHHHDEMAGVISSSLQRRI